ncbi:MAG TPA: hypothetical protein VEX86_14600 [Longimicrobium sp.]|nr:hypothetical protein [Longimicrobium sp.]
MSENEAQPQAAAETPVQLSENDLEQVAGGGWMEDIAAAIIDAIKPDAPSEF